MERRKFVCLGTGFSSKQGGDPGQHGACVSNAQWSCHSEACRALYCQHSTGMLSEVVTMKPAGRCIASMALECSVKLSQWSLPGAVLPAWHWNAQGRSCHSGACRALYCQHGTGMLSEGVVTMKPAGHCIASMALECSVKELSQLARNSGACRALYCQHAAAAAIDLCSNAVGRLSLSLSSP
jgi:hypothetical protein